MRNIVTTQTSTTAKGGYTFLRLGKDEKAVITFLGQIKDIAPNHEDGEDPYREEVAFCYIEGEPYFKFASDVSPEIRSKVVNRPEVSLQTKTLAVVLKYTINQRDAKITGVDGVYKVNLNSAKMKSLATIEMNQRVEGEAWSLHDVDFQITCTGDEKYQAWDFQARTKKNFNDMEESIKAGHHEEALRIINTEFADQYGKSLTEADLIEKFFLDEPEENEDTLEISVGG